MLSFSVQCIVFLYELYVMEVEWVIELKNVSKIYKRNNEETVALNNVNLHIEKGDIFGVIGYSGAGKSTLIRLINYLEQPTSGDIYVDEKNLGSYTNSQLRHVRKDIGMIFQHFNLLQAKTIYQNIAIPLILAKQPKHIIKERVLELLKFVGLEDKANSYPNELSGGQKQRIGIARALATNPSILLCDEATSALDPQTTDSILQLLKQINEKYKITIVMITHEMSTIQKICHKVAVMEEGRVIEEGEVTKVFSQPKQQATKDFVKTVIQDQVPQKVVETMKHALESRFIIVKFHDEINEKINKWIHELGLTVNIVHASVHEIKTNTVGTLILQLSGDKGKMEEALLEAQQSTLLVKELVS